MANNGSSTRFRGILGESAVIVFSVLLALFANEWRSNVNERRATDVILNNILFELRENHDIAFKAHEYHLSVLDTLQRLYVELAEDSLFNGFYFNDFKLMPQGVMQKGLNDIAWTVAKEERLATRVPFESSKKLYDAYRQQESVNRTLNRISDLTFDRRTHTEEATIRNIVMLTLLFSELTSQEAELLYRYELAIAELN
ncbi:MAG: hypothetical protein J4F31_09675 [Flavobacteriales bacterium]|nr:hypothetical protein [Flavobacteriales bacterium]